MRDHEQRAGPTVEQVLHHGEHVRVEVVSRLVEDEHVGFVQKDAQQREPAALPAREVAHARGELALLEAQALGKLGGALRAPVDHVASPVAPEHVKEAPAPSLGQRVQVLAHPPEAHRGPDPHPARRGREPSRHHLEQGRLARSVGAEDAVAVPGPYDPAHVVEHARAVAVGERDALHLDDLLAEPAHGEPLELDGVSERRVVGDERAGGLHAKARLARAGLGAVREPVELLAQGVLTALLGRGGQPLALDALLDVGGVAALEGLDPTVVDLPHPLADLVEEPPVVRHHEKRPLARGPPPAQVRGQPLDGGQVEVVGRLVHEDDVVGPREHAREVRPATLPAGELAYARVERDVAHEPLEDRADARVGRPDVVGHLAEDGLPDARAIVERVRLPEVAHLHVPSPGDASLVRLDDLSHDLEERGLAVAVPADDADPVALVDADRLV